MHTHVRSLADVTNEQLLIDVRTLAAHEREATAQLIASLAELDVRQLYLGEGFPSLFAYCTECLHLSEHATYGRIEAARAARKWPLILEMLAQGSITLTTVGLLGSHLTDENHRAVLDAARHKRKREVQEQVAALRPQPPVPSSVRKLPAPQRPPDATRLTGSVETPSESATPPTVADRPAVVALLAPERYKVQLTIGRDTHDKLRRVQDLIRHAVPNGDPAVIFDRALTLLLNDLERKKLAQVTRPRAATQSTPGSRHVPAAVRREVWMRDGGQCAFTGTRGRCAERGFLEFHHVVPFAEGGETTSANLELRCRAHNAYEAKEHFGPLRFRETPPPYYSVQTEQRETISPDEPLG